MLFDTDRYSKIVLDSKPPEVCTVILNCESNMKIYFFVFYELKQFYKRPEKLLEQPSNFINVQSKLESLAPHKKPFHAIKIFMRSMEKFPQSVKAVPCGILRYRVFIKHRARVFCPKMPTQPEASPSHIRNVVAGKLVHKINFPYSHRYDISLVGTIQDYVKHISAKLYLCCLMEFRRLIANLNNNSLGFDFIWNLISLKHSSIKW